MQAEVSVAMGITADELVEFDAAQHKSGAGRVPAALRAALKRNELSARRMRATENYSYKVLTCDEVGQLRSMATTMMNVDLALLHAASYLVESPVLCLGRVLPPRTHDWRSLPTLYRSAIVSCRQLYDAYRPMQTTPFCSLVLCPKFLSKSRDKAVTLFREQR